MTKIIDMENRKFNLYDKVIIHDSFVKEYDGCVGEIIGFICIDWCYCYDIKIENGRYLLGVSECMIELVN